MKLFEAIKEKVDVIADRYLESEEELNKELEAVTESPPDMFLPQEIVGEDIKQKADEILQEAVAELDQAEDTIYAVKDCIETTGEDSTSAMITKMLIRVAKKDPEILRKDGENRIKQIEKVLKDINASSQKAMEEATKQEAQIREAENATEASYTFDVSKLNSQCEEQIMELRLNLQKDIEAREKQRDAELESLKQRKEEMKKERMKMDSLKEAVIEKATKQQEEINLYLSKLQVEV